MKRVDLIRHLERCGANFCGKEIITRFTSIARPENLRVSRAIAK